MSDKQSNELARQLTETIDAALRPTITDMLAGTSRLTIRLPDDVRERLTRLAEEQQTTVSALVRRELDRLAAGAEPPPSLQAPLNERELAAIRRLDRMLVEAVERFPRARRRYLYARLRTVLRGRELQAAMEPSL